MDARRARKDGFRKIGEVAALFRTTPRTLLYYEEQGILTPAKTTKGTRMYSEADLKVFATAQELSRLGIPLRTVRHLVHASKRSADPKEIASSQAIILDELAGKLRRQIQRIDLMTADIEAARELLKARGGDRSFENEGDDDEAVDESPEDEEMEQIEPQILSLLQAEGADVRLSALADDECD